jgi:hypothetical protein
MVKRLSLDITGAPLMRDKPESIGVLADGRKVAFEITKVLEEEIAAGIGALRTLERLPRNGIRQSRAGRDGPLRLDALS